MRDRKRTEVGGANIPRIVIPRDHMSAFVSYFCRSTTSGAIQLGYQHRSAKFSMAFNKITVPTKLFRLPKSEPLSSRVGLARDTPGSKQSSSAAGREASLSSCVSTSFMSPPTPKSARRMLPSGAMRRLPAFRSRWPRFDQYFTHHAYVEYPSSAMGEVVRFDSHEETLDHADRSAPRAPALSQP